mgnify:FL=1
MKPAARIILASASPRRQQLLEQIGITAIARGVDLDETRKPGEPVAEYVNRLAMEKAQLGAELIDNTQSLPVLGSDTIVEIDGNVLGKPENREAAKDMLRLLSGKKHAVHTSVAIVTRDEILSDISRSIVEFKHLSEDEIERYVATGEADDKAGSYAVQGLAAQFIKNINGSFSGIMGLPVYETVRLLKKCGVDPL